MTDLYHPSSSTAIVANGTVLENSINAAYLNTFSSLIAVDGGINHCWRMHLKPKLLVGDLDSASAEALAHYSDISIKKFPQDKDESDLEIALRLEKEVTNHPIVVFGAFGTRGDHTLYNLHLLEKNPQRVFLETETETWFAIDGPITLFCKPQQTLSLMVLNNTPENVTTRGLKWELQNARFDKGFMSLSNICLKDKIDISLTKGTLLGCLVHALK